MKNWTQVRTSCRSQDGETSFFKSGLTSLAFNVDVKTPDASDGITIAVMIGTSSGRR